MPTTKNWWSKISNIFTLKIKFLSSVFGHLRDKMVEPMKQQNLLQSDICEQATKLAEVNKCQCNVLAYMVLNLGCCLRQAYAHCRFEQPEKLVRTAANGL